MSDSNTLFLQTASSVMSELDVRYMEASQEGKAQLKEDLDRAMMTFSEIRCKILENEVSCSLDDVAKMQTLCQEIETAGELQTVLAIAVRLTRILAQL
jgi:hypothetical protein